MRYHKRCWHILTAGRWPWKSEPAKDRVTTHLPNVPALKMDGAQATRPYPARGAGPTRRGVGGRGGGDKALGASPGRTAASADLGESSKYFNENLKDRSGEGFHVNSGWTWVSRSLAIGKFRFKGAPRPAWRKGSRSTFRRRDAGFSRQRNRTRRRWRGPWAELSFLLNGPSPWNRFVRR
jgi:hypothetical protein